MNRTAVVLLGIGTLIWVTTVSYLVYVNERPLQSYFSHTGSEPQRNSSEGPLRDFSPKRPGESLVEFARRRFEGCPYLNGSTPLFLDPERDNWVYPFGKDHDMVTQLIFCRVPFAFARYGDGEYILARGWEIGEDSQARKADHWSWKGGLGKLGKELGDTLRQNYTDIIYIQAFPKPGSVFNGILAWFVSETTQSTRYLSSALLWMGSNWRRTHNLFTYTISAGKLEQPIIPIINEDAWARRDLLLKWCKDIVFFPDDGPNWWETEGVRAARYYENIARAHNNVLFIVGLGPVSEVVIYHMALANPNNQYVDFGSSMELWTKGASTRSFTLDVPEDGGWQYRKNETGLLEVKID